MTTRERAEVAVRRWYNQVEISLPASALKVLAGYLEEGIHAAIHTAVTEEREACAQVADRASGGQASFPEDLHRFASHVLAETAAAIRARTGSAPRP